MARRYGARHMAWVRSFRKKGGRRRKMRRNSWPVAGMVVNKRRRYRRNPSFVGERGTRVFGFQLPSLTAVAMTGAGFVGAPMVEGFVARFLPGDLMTNTVGRYAVKIGSVVGLAYLAKTLLGSREAAAVGIGGGLYVGLSALREFAPTMLPATVRGYTPMSGYTAMGRPFLEGMGRALPGAAAVSSSGNVVAPRFNRFGGAA